MVHIISLLKGRQLIGDKAFLEAYTRSGIGEVFWIITDKCNLKCVHCYRDAASGRRCEVSMMDSFHIIDKISRLGRPLIFISGGEPFTIPYLTDVLRELKNRGFRVVLSSNGTLIDENAAEHILEIGVDYVALPLYGGELFHDCFTGVKGSYSRVMDALRLLRDSDVNLALKTVISRSTLPNINYILNEALNNDVKILYLCDLLPLGRGTYLSGDVLAKDEWRQLLNKLVGEILDYGYDVEIDIGLHPSAAIYILRELGVNVLSTLSKAPSRLAPEGRGFISIAPNGDVSISHFLPHMKIGNVLENDLEQVVNHPLYKAVGDSNNLGGRCGGCEFKYVCGGSRVKAYVYKGNLLEEDPTCLID